jgi:hypothetical protein
MIRSILPALLALGAACSGCAAKHNQAGGVTLLVDPPCITQPLELTGCAASMDPPKCRRVKVVFRKGCERINAAPITNEHNSSR